VNAAPTYLLDTDVLIRYFTRDDETKAARALALLQRDERAELRLVVSPIVVFETVSTLHRFYRRSRAQIRSLVRPVIALRGVRVRPPKRVYYRALDLFAEVNVPFGDAFNVAYMEWQRLPAIYAWDTDHDKFAGISRLEPEAGAPLPPP
jgi:predicted nucleic acid-binding protein